MKKFASYLFLFLTLNSLAQKNKATVLASTENVKVQIITENKKQNLVLLVEKSGKTETVVLKEILTKDKNQYPSNVKITPITVGGIKLFHVYYDETLSNDTKLKKTKTAVNTNEIWDLSETNTKVFTNEQKVINVSEIKFLDKGKTASHTVDTINREGYAFSLSKDNKITLSTKSTNTVYVFNAKTKKFELKK